MAGPVACCSRVRRYRSVSQSLSAALLSLYQLTRGTPSTQFRDAAMQAVSQVVPMHSGLWGTGVSTSAGARVHSVYLHHLPARMMEDYALSGDKDWLHYAVTSNSGVTLNIAGYEGEQVPEILEHRRRYDMCHCLATAWMEPALGIWTAISFYRGPEGPAFAEHERQLEEQLVLHLVEARHLNAFRFLERPPEAVRALRRGRALADAAGFVYNAESTFAELLSLEYSDSAESSQISLHGLAHPARNGGRASLWGGDESPGHCGRPAAIPHHGAQSRSTYLPEASRYEQSRARADDCGPVIPAGVRAAA